MALLCSVDVRIARLKLCFYLLFMYFYFFFYTHNVCTIYLRQKNTLDIGHRYTNLLQDFIHESSGHWNTRNTEENKGNLNNPRRGKKHRGETRWNPQQTEGKGSQSSSTEILLANVQSLENKMDDLRARISFQRDIRDCNILF